MADLEVGAKVRDLSPLNKGDGIVIEQATLFGGIDWKVEFPNGERRWIDARWLEVLDAPH